MRHPTDRASRLFRIRAEIADGTYETPDKIETVTDRVHAKLRGWFGWRDGENHDGQPLVHTGYTHELLSPPPRRRPTPGGGVSLEIEP